LPNVIVTSHQAFLTSDALFSIAKTTLGNILDWRDGKPLLNGICAECADKLNMPKCTESKK
jgi:D-lactate dehydrogenase